MMTVALKPAMLLFQLLLYCLFHEGKFSKEFLSYIWSKPAIFQLKPITPSYHYVSHEKSPSPDFL